MKNLRLFLGLLFLSLIFRLIISISVYSGDLNNHVQWGQSNLSYGFPGAYNREYSGVMQPTYPPIPIYAFTTSVGLYNLIYGTASYLNKSVSVFPSSLIWLLEDQDVLPAFTKIITIVTDIGISLLIYYLIRRIKPNQPKTALMCGLAYAFNPAVWYVSSLWGQIESVPLFFLLLSLFTLFRKQPVYSALAFTAALLSKQTTIIFIPFFLLLFFKTFHVAQIIKSATISLLVWILAYLPFQDSRNPFWAFYVYINRLQTGSGSVWITDHAFNPWIWVSHLEKIPDSVNFIGNISPLNIGLILFATCILLVTIYFFKHKASPYLTFITYAVTPMLSFVLLTKMHERYFAPALPFLLLSTVFNPYLWIVYILTSFAHLINLYHNWYFPRIIGVDTWVSQWSTIELTAILFTLCTFLVLVATFRYNRG